MLKSMTGFSKLDLRENGYIVSVELKSLNGRYLEVNCRVPRALSFREIEIRDIIKTSCPRGSVTININVEKDVVEKSEEIFNLDVAKSYLAAMTKLKKELKMKDIITFENVLQFANNFVAKETNDDSEEEWKVIRRTIKEALKSLDKMKAKEGQNIYKDLTSRLKKIAMAVEKIETLSKGRVPAEREKMRQKVAQLFELDEIDEHRIQMEILVLANKLDISEECVRLKSHLKFFNDAFKINDPVGQKLNFLLQEMNREINTIGSKSDDAEISQVVISVKEEIERIREQVQNIE
jgi:uncharacterized protein (TIGR00255 family)